MTGDDLPDGDHVVRYASPRLVDGRKVYGSLFQLRQTDAGLSVNWLECFQGLSKSRQLDEVRQLSRLGMRRNGRLVELNVGVTKRHMPTWLDALRFIHKPRDADDVYEADPSHSEIIGLPQEGSPQAKIVGTMIARRVTAIYPALAED